MSENHPVSSVSEVKNTLDAPLSHKAFRRRIAVLKWAAPAALVVLVIGYELGLSRLVYEAFGPPYHFALDTLVYGIVGPILVFWLLDFLSRWLDERETSDLQARMLAQTREHARLSQELHDSTLQSLFAIGLLLDTVESGLSDLPPAVAGQLQVANKALGGAIQQLREHLLKHPESLQTGFNADTNLPD